MTSAYYRGAVGAIVAFDVTKVSSVLFRYRLNPDIAWYRIFRISFYCYFDVIPSTEHSKNWIRGWNNCDNTHTTILSFA